jgi:hypothetical protein
MTWPGSTAPTRLKKKSKKKSRRRGANVTGPSPLLLKIAQREGIVEKPPKKTEAKGYCLPHIFEFLNFSSPWALAMFADSLAARSRSRQEYVRLPRWKTERGIRAVARRCTVCRGRGAGCRQCQGFGWGIVLHVSRKLKAKDRLTLPEEP